MPTYEYVCRVCGHEFEKFQSMTDEPVKSCPKCRKRQVRRKIGMGAGVIFKGSGFYETDYKRKGGEKKESPSGEKTDGKTDGKSDGKSDGGSSGSDSKAKESSSDKSSPDSGSGSSNEADS
ncbi:MAG: zinc ribbon domain-containing protein [Opitutales bacterium]